MPSGASYPLPALPQPPLLSPVLSPAPCSQLGQTSQPPCLSSSWTLDPSPTMGPLPGSTVLLRTLVLLCSLLLAHAQALQCLGCNVVQGGRYVDVGCANPVVITCSHSHQGFKHRFCIRTQSMALGMVLTRGCATSRHCQQKELPGVAIHCCPSDLCNSTACWRPVGLHWLAALGLLGVYQQW